MKIGPLTGVGAIVKLKSGGPAMTVESMIGGPNSKVEVVCIWFAGSTLKRCRFPSQALNPTNANAAASK